MWRGGLGLAYLFPALSSAGASMTSLLHDTPDFWTATSMVEQLVHTTGRLTGRNCYLRMDGLSEAIPQRVHRLK